MKSFVFEVPKEKQKDAEKMLAENPYEDGSFAKSGYTFREAKGLGIQREGYYLFFECEEEKTAKGLEKKAKDAGLKEAGEKEKDEVVKAIRTQEEGAAEGIGSLFG